MLQVSQVKNDSFVARDELAHGGVKNILRARNQSAMADHKHNPVGIMLRLSSKRVRSCSGLSHRESPGRNIRAVVGTRATILCDREVADRLPAHAPTNAPTNP